MTPKKSKPRDNRKQNEIREGLQQFVGKCFMHTGKAVKQGEPKNRLFLVVDVVEDEGEWWLLAWKATLLRTGMVEHPGHLGLVSQWELAEYPERFFYTHESKQTHSRPTAMFRPDSLYKLVKLPVGEEVY